MKKFIQILLAVSLCLSAFAHADVDKEALKTKLKETMPSLTVEDIKPSEIKGLYEVMAGANIFYVSEDGRYLIQGRMFDLGQKRSN